MKKTVFLVSAGLLLSIGSYAQKDKLREANRELEKATTTLKDKPDDAAAALLKAKDAVDAAAEHADTKDKAEVWLAKAGIYLAMQGNAKTNGDMPFKAGVEALNKAISINKKLESDPQAINMIVNAAYYLFNDGISTYNGGKYGDAYNSFKTAKEMLGKDKDKRFQLYLPIDTLRAQSEMFMGFNAFYDQQYEKAVSSLSAAKSSPYLTEESNVYLVLAQAYEKLGDKQKQEEAIKEGKSKFPNDKNLNALEVNIALQSGDESLAIKKIEEAISKDPTNPELYLNLGILYSNLAAASKDKAGEYNASAEKAYKKAVEIAPESGTYNYQLGSYYFNLAADIIKEMNNLGTSKEDEKKYNLLNAEKDKLFANALPYLEKSKDIFSPNLKKLKAEERKSYVNCLNGLKEIYSRNDDTAKANAIRELINKIPD